MLGLLIVRKLGTVFIEYLIIWHAVLRFYSKIRAARPNAIFLETRTAGIRSGTRDYPPARAGYWRERFPE